MSAVEQLHSLTSEAQIHRAIVAQLRVRAVSDVVWWHTPNDAKRSPGTAKRLQTMGMRKGVHDLCFVHRGNFYSMEIKSSRGRPTVEQMKFASDVNAAGGHAMIVHDIDRALRALQCWGLIR